MLSSQDEARHIIPIRNSYHTVQELELRETRVDSLINNSGFLLIDEPDTMGMPSLESLQRFKAGLKDALYITERLSDLGASLPSHQMRDDDSIEPKPLLAVDSGPASSPSDEAGILAHTAQLAAQFRQMEALRDLQAAHLRALPSRDLAWAVTLAAGASKGYARYSSELLKNDPAMADARVMAFKEVLLRGGPFVLWAFTRGGGSLGGFVRRAVWQVAEEVLFFEGGVEVGGQRMPDGLHMTAMGELRRRLVERRRGEAAAEGVAFDEDEVDSRDVWGEINGVVGAEVGWSGWRGYAAVVHPCHE